MQPDKTELPSRRAPSPRLSPAEVVEVVGDVKREPENISGWTPFTFTTRSEERSRPLPHKIIIGQNQNETIRHVSLKFLAWVLFYRERLQIETDLNNAVIPFVPDLAEVGYDMRPRLWVECGECTTNKLHKLAGEIITGEPIDRKSVV